MVGYEVLLQVFNSASSREENSLCMQSRDAGEHPRRCFFLTREGAFYRLGPEYDKNYCW